MNATSGSILKEKEFVIYVLPQHASLKMLGKVFITKKLKWTPVD